MWSKVWLLLGREEEMPEPGDYQVEEVGPESFLMARQDDGSVKTFYNVCHTVLLPSIPPLEREIDAAQARL
jgi:phenylpropionate dioxygenase-like ring-hydroxylating dioxygenase large terminal subunit